MHEEVVGNGAAHAEADNGHPAIVVVIVHFHNYILEFLKVTPLCKFICNAGIRIKNAIIILSMQLKTLDPFN